MALKKRGRGTPINRADRSRVSLLRMSGACSISIALSRCSLPSAEKKPLTAEAWCTRSLKASSRTVLGPSSSVCPAALAIPDPLTWHAAPRTSGSHPAGPTPHLAMTPVLAVSTLNQEYGLKCLPCTRPMPIQSLALQTVSRAPPGVGP